MNTARKLYQQEEIVTPALAAIESHPAEENARLNEVYKALGWDDLPHRLKFAVAPDIVGYYDELRGLYSTCDPKVIARRKTVTYWIENYRSRVSSLETTLEMLRIGCQ